MNPSFDPTDGLVLGATVPVEAVLVAFIVAIPAPVMVMVAWAGWFCTWVGLRTAVYQI
jgi:hypothetical protein